MMIVFKSFVLDERFVIKIEKVAKSARRMMFLAMSDRVVSGLSIKVTPSTMRNMAMISLFCMMTLILFETLSTFSIVLSKSSFLDIFYLCYESKINGTPGGTRTHDFLFRRQTL